DPVVPDPREVVAAAGLDRAQGVGDRARLGAVLSGCSVLSVAHRRDECSAHDPDSATMRAMDTSFNRFTFTTLSRPRRLLLLATLIALGCTPAQRGQALVGVGASMCGAGKSLDAADVDTGK